MKELECDILGVKIKYKFKPKKYDNNHLIVVFSGFGAISEFTYDFENLLQESNANVLWIKDDFFGHCSYYLCNQMNFNIEKAVITFINKQIKNLGLTKNNCSLIGFSKGGTAALYYGIKYCFKNILITVPQTFIGNYIKQDWPIIAKHMMGENFSSKEVDKLNKIIMNLLKNDNDREKNIYLVTSKKDEQYNTEIIPLVDELYKYSNMNYILSESIFVRAHNHVTSHHAQFILGILYILSNNIAPFLGSKVLKGESADIIKDRSADPVVNIKHIKLNQGLLFIEGVALLRGIEFKEYSDVDYGIKFVSIESQKAFEYKLAKCHRANLTKDYFNGDFVIYDKAWVTTLKHNGLNIEDLEVGTYELHLLIYAVKENIMKSVPLSFDKCLELQSCHSNRTYTINNSEENIILQII